MAQVIGFAGTYYTLWHVGEPYQKWFNQFDYEIVRDYTYIQNLSHDLSQAKAKVKGEFTIDENLRGDKGWTFSETLGKGTTLLDTQFSFGKLVGQDITGSDDIWQLKRAVEAERGRRRRAIARRRLITLGVIIRYNRKWVLAEKLEEIKQTEYYATFKHGHYFSEKETIEIKVKIVNHFNVSTMYGACTVVRYADEQNRLFKYFGSSPLLNARNELGDYVDLPEWFTIKAVVSHTRFDEEDQTMLKRIRLVADKKQMSKTA